MKNVCWAGILLHIIVLFYVESIQWPHFIPGLWIQISNCLVTKFLQRYSITQAYYCHLAIYYIDRCPCLATHTMCTQVAQSDNICVDNEDPCHVCTPQVCDPSFILHYPFISPSRPPLSTQSILQLKMKDTSMSQTSSFQTDGKGGQRISTLLLSSHLDMDQGHAGVGH